MFCCSSGATAMIYRSLVRSRAPVARRADQHSARSVNSLKVVHHPDEDAFLALHAVANNNFATGFKMLAELTHMLEQCSGAKH
jgi:hypothetical protein